MILHFHDFPLLLFVCLQHLLGVLKCGDGYGGDTLRADMIRLQGALVGNVAVCLVEKDVVTLLLRASLA